MATALNRILERSVAFMDRVAILEQAKLAALSGVMDEALKLVGILLANDPKDIEALCFKGNTLELAYFSDPTTNTDSDEAQHDNRVLCAKDCYEEALSLDSFNIKALRDSADNLKLIGNIVGARAFYQKLAIILKDQTPSGISGIAIKEELEEVLQELNELGSP